jgi:hypothetical protein
MSFMRRATAVRRLRTIAERCQQVCTLWEPGSGLLGVCTFGPLLDPPDEDASIEVIQLVLVVAHDPAELTWGCRPPTFSGLPYVLELEKAPVDWYFRPVARPVGNHRIVRPLEIWSRSGGVHEPALVALAGGDGAALERLREPAPRPAVLQRQLGEELAAAAARLQQVRDRFWARGWRQAHHAAGSLPENHLWDAVNGYLDLLAAAGGSPGSPEATAVAGLAAVEGLATVDPGDDDPPVPTEPWASEGLPEGAVSPVGAARRTRRAAAPARRRGSRGAPPDS